MATESVKREELGAVSATRTVDKRRELSVWDIALTRGTKTDNRSATVHELREEIRGEAIRRKVFVSEKELAVFDFVPNTDPPDPGYVDQVDLAQGKIDDLDALVEDLEFLLDVLVQGGE